MGAFGRCGFRHRPGRGGTPDENDQEEKEHENGPRPNHKRFAKRDGARANNEKNLIHRNTLTDSQSRKDQSVNM